MFATLDDIRSRIGTTRGMIVAGDESLLRSLPKGAWIGGTIPYFMTADGGCCARDRGFLLEAPRYATATRLAVYDESSISRIAADAPEHGYTLVVIPAFSPLHQRFAMESPQDDQQLLKVIAGWVAGTHTDDLGRISPKVFDGRLGQAFENHAVAMHVEIPSRYQARIGIVNIFEPQPGPSIEFLQSGFEVRDCLIDGKRENIVDFLARSGLDVRFPLIADFCGSKINVSIRSADARARTLRFYAPVFEGVRYRPAKHIESYAERFAAAVPADTESVFACNCMLNYVHGGLEGQKTGAFLGPMTFGEIAYQLLNQTLVYISVGCDGGGEG